MSLTRLPDIKGHFEAVSRVEKLLADVTAALDRAGVPYAVIGGNAVAAWVEAAEVGASRATKDVDIMLRRADLAAASRALEHLGLIQTEAGSVTVFVDRENPRPSQGVHVLFAAERVRSTDPILAPDLSNVVRAQSGFCVIDLLSLLHMKLHAFRLHDQVHLQDLFKVGLITPELAKQLPSEFQERLRQVRDTLEWTTTKPDW